VTVTPTDVAGTRGAGGSQHLYQELPRAARRETVHGTTG
jgi:hypothetical protein